MGGFRRKITSNLPEAFRLQVNAKSAAQKTAPKASARAKCGETVKNSHSPDGVETDAEHGASKSSWWKGLQAITGQPTDGTRIEVVAEIQRIHYVKQRLETHLACLEGQLAHLQRVLGHLPGI